MSYSISNLAYAFDTFPLLFYSVTCLFGLIVGSFLNVVIYRLPVMMEREWREQCTELLDSNSNQATEQYSEKFNLSTPRSRCGHCGHLVRVWENIPILSYLFLKGRCATCGTHLSIQYPLIELATGILSVMIAMHFGFTATMFAALLLTWALITLSMIDFNEMLLPDSITLPFLWIGLLLSTTGLFTNPIDSIIGAAVGYMSLWLLFHTFKLLTGKEGMGYGDFKLLALLGAWLGWQALPTIIIMSSFVGAVIGIGLIIFTGRDKQIPIPFGPYLAIAGWIYLLYGEWILKTYSAWLQS